MSPTRLALLASVGLALVFAGCLTAPVGLPTDDRTAAFGASNADNETYVVTFSLAPTVEGFAVTFANNVTVNYPMISSPGEIPASTVARAVRIVPLGEDVRTVSYRLQPGEGVGTTVGSVPRDVVIVYTVANPARDEPLRTVGVDSCGPGTVESDLDIRINPGGHINSSSICRG